MVAICDCGDPVNEGDHRRCYLIDVIEWEGDYGDVDAAPVGWEP